LIENETSPCRNFSIKIEINRLMPLIHSITRRPKISEFRINRMSNGRHKYWSKETHMRYYEFATPARPILKISQKALAAGANTAATPPPQNTPPTPTPAEPIKVYPSAWQREWLQRYLAAQIARDAQTIKPTADDIAIASIRYGEAQRAVDAEYERQTGKTARERRRVKRD
jgi:hypothetical protein